MAAPASASEQQGAAAEAAGKRPADGQANEEEPAGKRPRTEEAEGGAAPAAEEDDFDAIFAGQGPGLADLAELGELAKEPQEPPEEAKRRSFAEDLAAKGRLEESDLTGMLATLRDEAPHWGTKRHWRSVALMLVYAARSSRVLRAAFVAEGLPLLGSLLQEAVAGLEGGEAAGRQEAGMWTLACLSCLRALPLGRATLWEHRLSVGRPFDRLHRWCGKERSALAAELRGPTVALCRRWRRQPKPAGQETAPEQKALRRKVVEVISQGLLGIAGGNSPASPAPLSAVSPGPLPPNFAAAEVEAALYARHNGPTADYKSHARMLRTNLALPGNADLRAQVLSGEITAEELVSLDSKALAPEALQKLRREASRKYLKDSLVQTLVPCVGDNSDRESYNPATAPPVWEVKALPRRNSSQISIPEAESTSSTGPQPKPATATPPLEPPPTPFQDGAGASAAGGGAGAGAGEDPDVLATPAPDDEDEEEAALIRYLSARV